MRRQFFPVAGALNDDLVAGIGQPIQGAVLEDGVVEEAEPFFHGPVRVDSGKGQNRTLRLLLAFWPPVLVGGQAVGQELWLDCQAGVFPLSDRFAEMSGIPVDDDGGEQVEPGYAVLLALARAVTDLALTPEREREARPVASPAPHPDMLDVVVGQRVMAQQGGFVCGQVE